MKPQQLNSAATLADAQQDMRVSYLGGAPGMFASALAWLAAGIVALYGSPGQAVWTLFIGGMLIHPVGILLTKAFGRRGSHTPGNPLAPLALEGTAWLILSLPLAYLVFLLRADLFFPAMLFVIGGRYLTFSTLYGSRVYWVCGGMLVVAGFALATLRATPATAALAGAVIELAFAPIILNAARRETAVG